jgi:hypothetical protein
MRLKQAESSETIRYAGDKQSNVCGGRGIYITMLQGARRYGSNEAEPIDWIVPPARDVGKANVSGARGPASSIASRAASIPGISEMFAYHATTMANTIRTALLVFTRKVRVAADVACPDALLIQVQKAATIHQLARCICASLRQPACNR